MRHLSYSARRLAFVPPGRHIQVNAPARFYRAVRMTLTDMPITSTGRFSPLESLSKTDSLLPKLVAGLLDELLETRRRQ